MSAASNGDLPTARIVVTLSWQHNREPVREELRADEKRIFGRYTHDKIRDPAVSRQHFKIWCVDGLLWYVGQFSNRNGLRLYRPKSVEPIDVLAEAALYNGDRLIAGNTEFSFRINGVLIGVHDDLADMAETEAAAPDVKLHLYLTKRQLQVVVALVNPTDEDLDAGSPWASNAAIAKRLGISVDAVRSNLKAIYAELFSHTQLKQFAPKVDGVAKRTTLVNIAVRAGYREG